MPWWGLVMPLASDVLLCWCRESKANKRLFRLRPERDSSSLYDRHFNKFKPFTRWLLLWGRWTRIWGLAWDQMLCKFAFSWVHTRTFLLFQWLHRIFSFTDVITASSRGLCLTISINMGHNKLLSLFHPWYHNWQCCQRGTRVWVTPVDILSDNWRHLQPFLWYQNLVFFSGRWPFSIPGSLNIKKCSVSTCLGFCRIVLS